ncbi:YbaN family protein [Gilvimarinus chinensis]|uniref:YbaN family protein n=1 Tax=Gilvimarinus chinensis TaxID=396005 RepID=UPI00037370FB|nr:YbaN family protein [Gilvimarinus chinensis]
MPNKPQAKPAPALILRLPWLILAWLCVLLGMIGVFFPVMPTVPFLLVAAWAASKGSPKLHNWLYSHPRFGPLLSAWHERKAVPRYAKRLTPLLLIMSLVIMGVAGIPPWVMASCAAIFIAVTAYLWSRPDA